MSHRSVRPAPVRLSAMAAGCALLLATAVGCGNEADSNDSASDPAASETSSTTPSSSDSPSQTPSESGDTSDSSSGAGGSLTVGDTVSAGQAVVVSASNVTVEPTKRASALVDDAAVDAFVSSTDPQLADPIRSAVRAATVPAGSTLFGAVVAVGCDSPTGVGWSTTFDGVEVSATLPKTQVQCLVPETYVALFLVPDM